MSSPESPASPAESHDEDPPQQDDGQAKTTAAKDKECPYCHQHFTSSSLGRHLDQFLTKKKPDGIHNVDEVRKLRVGITRRTARNGKKDNHENNTSTASPAAPILPVEAQQAADRRLNWVPPAGLDIRLNRMHWSSTGVITDPTVLNPSATNSPLAGVTSPADSKKRSYATYSTEPPTSSTPTDQTRALELSLREVLDCLRAATKYTQTPPSPFTFDIHAQSYPSLVLRLLPTPPTLFQPSPFSTLISAPISPPGPDQLQPLRTKITNVIDEWKWNALRLAQRTTTNIADEAAFLSSQADTYTTTSLKHLQTCYENWMIHTSDIRSLLWNVELLRAYQTGKDKVIELEEEVERMRQEAAQLQQQVEYLSQCQWPREMALWPPERRTFGKAMREELRLVNVGKPVGGGIEGNSGVGTNGVGRQESEAERDPIERNPNMRTENVNTRGDKWDFEKLVDKWKAHVREDRTRRKPWLDAVAGEGSVDAAGLPRHPSGMDYYPAQARRMRSELERGMNDSPGGDATNGSTPDGASPQRDKGPRPIRKNISIISDWDETTEMRQTMRDEQSKRDADGNNR